MFSRRLWFHQICSLYNDPLRLKKKIKEDWEKNTHHGWTEWNQRGFDRQSERASGKAFANGDVAGWWGWASGDRKQEEVSSPAVGGPPATAALFDRPNAAVSWGQVGLAACLPLPCSPSCLSVSHAVLLPLPVSLPFVCKCSLWQSSKNSSSATKYYCRWNQSCFMPCQWGPNKCYY